MCKGQRRAIALRYGKQLLLTGARTMGCKQRVGVRYEAQGIGCEAIASRLEQRKIGEGKATMLVVTGGEGQRRILMNHISLGHCDTTRSFRRSGES